MIHWKIIALMQTLRHSKSYTDYLKKKDSQPSFVKISSDWYGNDFSIIVEFQYQKTTGFYLGVNSCLRSIYQVGDFQNSCQSLNMSTWTHELKAYMADMLQKKHPFIATNYIKLIQPRVLLLLGGKPTTTPNRTNYN